METVERPLKVYTRSGHVVELVDGFKCKLAHTQLLREIQEHIKTAIVKVRDQRLIEWRISIGMLYLDQDLLQALNDKLV